MIVKGLKAIHAYEDMRSREELLAVGTADEVSAAYIKDMQTTGVPGAWHYQQFGLGDEVYMRYVVALFSPTDELVAYIGDDETPYKAYLDAMREIDNGDYPFNWEELSESTARHTAAWEELDPTPETECNCPPECKETMKDLW